MKNPKLKLSWKRTLKRVEASAVQLLFSAHRCFSLNKDPQDRKCIRLIVEHLLKIEALALVGNGSFLKYLLDLEPRLAKHALCLVTENGIYILYRKPTS